MDSRYVSPLKPGPPALRARFTWTGVLTLLAFQPIVAQDHHSTGEGRPPSTWHEWPVDPATYPTPVHTATRAAGPITIDGLPDEAAWEQAVPLTTFIQNQPNLGYPATEKTDVRILYDDGAIYLACFCYDSQPDNLTVTSLERDFPVPTNDAVAFVFDPNLDRRNGFVFSVNPYGALWDGQAFDDHRVLDSSWDGLADVAVRRTNFGWTMELKIPWSTLRFEESEGARDWGLNVLRRVRRINEVSYWAPLERYENLPKVSRAGTLGGLAGARQTRNLRVKPYALASMASKSQAPGAGSDVEVGGDLKYVLDSSMTLDVTYRTDFSHVEADEVQLNLTRFPLLFPERREFFIENSGIFDFGDGTQRVYRTSVSPQDFTLFHTRRVALTESGEPVPVLAGTRLSGNVGSFELGAMGMRTRPTPDRTQENFGVVRLRRRFMEDSNVGLLLTHRNLEGGDGAFRYNRAYGIDANVLLADHLLLTSYVAATEAPDLTSSTSDRAAVRVSAGWRDRLWNTTLVFRRFGGEFDPGLGFVRRNAMQHYYGTIGIHPRVEGFRLQEINPYAEIDYFTNLESVLETRRAAAGLGFTFEDGSQSSLTYENLFERLIEPFQIPSSELTIESGEYQTHEIAFSHQTSPARLLSGNVRLSRGGYFGGTRTSYAMSGAWRPSPYVFADLTLERNEIVAPVGELVADVGRVRLRITPTTKFLTSAFIQYNGLTEEVGTNVRVRFIHAPLSDLYLVYSEQRDIGDSRHTDRSVAIKLTRLFAF